MVDKSNLIHTLKDIIPSLKGILGIVEGGVKPRAFGYTCQESRLGEVKFFRLLVEEKRCCHGNPVDPVTEVYMVKIRKISIKKGSASVKRVLKKSKSVLIKNKEEKRFELNSKELRINLDRLQKDAKTEHVRIKAKPDSQVDLTQTKEELAKLDPKATWFLHISKKMLLNGSTKNIKMKPSRLSLKKVIEILKDRK